MHPILNQYFELIKKFLPTKKEGISIGLDIGAGECKLVEISKSDSTFELKNFAIQPIKGSDIGAGVQSVLATLTEECTSVYSSVSGKGTLIRYIEMPKMSLDELRNSFAIESDKYFPFAQDQIYTDCYIVEDNKKGKEMSVMAAAAKKDIIDQRLKALSDIGIKVDFIGINPIALANALNVLGVPAEPQAGHAYAVLDMGEAISNLQIFIDRVPRFTRDIFIGGRDFTKSISNALGVDLQQAEKIKKELPQNHEKISNSFESAILNIVQELRLSFDYFNNEKNCELVKLYLTGGTSMLHGLKESLEKKLDIKVELWNPLMSLRIADDLNKSAVEANAMKLGVALGLALYQYD